MDEFNDVVSGATADNPICISNAHDPLEIVFDEINVIPYFQVATVQSVVLKGREGIWHLISCKPHALYEDIADEMDDD